jgi:flagellar basal-body rod protein FlgF
MLKGLYSAATALVALDQRQEVLANNIANLSSPGFKRQNVLLEGFYQTLEKALSPAMYGTQRGPGGGVRVENTFTDFSRGSITHTGDPLNIALDGPGFIAVNTARGERYTRDGALSIDAEGRLVAVGGLPVQSQGGGNIVVTGSQVRIANDGTVFSDGDEVGRVRLVEFEDPAVLQRAGANLYVAPDAAQAEMTEASETSVAPESLEMGNMILGLRAYAANQRVITSFDDTLGRLIDQVGMPI